MGTNGVFEPAALTRHAQVISGPVGRERIPYDDTADLLRRAAERIRELEGELEDAIKGNSVVEVSDPGPLEAVKKRNTDLEEQVAALELLTREAIGCEYHTAGVRYHDPIRQEQAERLERILDGEWKPIERISMAAKILGPLTRECGIRVSLTAIKPGGLAPGWDDMHALGHVREGEYELEEMGHWQDTRDVTTEDGVEIAAQQPRRAK